MEKKEGSIKKDDDLIIEDDNIEDYDIDELIERPRISSIPKINLNTKFDNENEEDEKEETFCNNNFRDNKQEYDINLKEYSRNLQIYIKEKHIKLLLIIKK